MNQIGRKIYYDISTGNIIIDTGEREGTVIPTTVEQDISSIKTLSERVRNTFDYIELPFGAYSQDFLECNGYRVNLETRTIEFSYPDPNNPNESIIQPSYEDRLKSVEDTLTMMLGL